MRASSAPMEPPAPVIRTRLPARMRGDAGVIERRGVCGR